MDDGRHPVWLLSSKGRPLDAQSTIDACQDAGMTSQGVLYVDETVDEYRDIKLPKNWRIHLEPQWLSLQGSLQWCFNEYPDATQYGWLADDTRPRTKGWDKLIEDATGDWNLAYARDLWLSESPGAGEQLANGHDLSSGLCWGGELVRAVGWWALPGVRQAGIDTAWSEIIRPLNLHRYLRDVVVEHLNWRTGKRPKDETDEWLRGGEDYIDRDLQIRADWCASAEFRNTLRRVNDAMGNPDATHHSTLDAIRTSYADQSFRVQTLPAARLIKIMEGGFNIDEIDGLCANADKGSS